MMLFPALRRTVLCTFALALLTCLPGRLHAELVWTPESGWTMQGGALGPADLNSQALELMNRARATEERGGYRTAIKLYAKVTKEFPNSIFSPEAWYRTGYLRLKRKQYYKAFEAFQQVIGRYPNTKRFDTIVAEQYRIAYALLHGARNYIWGVFPGFRDRERAIGYFEVLLVDAPYGQYAPQALMNIVKGHEMLHQPDAAIDALDRMINAYPQSPLTPDAYLKLAQDQAKLVEGPPYDQAPAKVAMTYFQDFMILYPNSPHIAEAVKGLNDIKLEYARSKIVMADYYFHHRYNYTAARVFYNEAITAYPDSEVAALAKKRLAAVDAAAAKAAKEELHPRKKWFFFF